MKSILLPTILGLFSFVNYVSAGTPTFYPANHENIRWVGRRIFNADGGITIDWENTFGTFTIVNATIVSAIISDNSTGGARFAVYMNNVNVSATIKDPNQNAADVPNLRIATLVTANAQKLQYPLASRSGIAGSSPTMYSLKLLTEPQFIGDNTYNNVLTIDGISTDGVLLPLNSATIPTRRIEILGDSLTAGYGSGFDDPVGSDGQPLPCGGGTLIDDVSNTYGNLLCTNFSADCTIEAVSGITLMTGHPNLPELWDYELGSMIEPGWSGHSIPYNAKEFVPQVEIINLGENDWHSNCPSSPSCIANFTQKYVDFVKHIDSTYTAVGGSNITYFLIIAPHEAGQSVAVIPAANQLKSEGFNAYFVNGTVDSSLYPGGCGGHPGPTIHHASFLRMQPIIASIMGW